MENGLSLFIVLITWFLQVSLFPIAAVNPRCVPGGSQAVQILKKFPYAERTILLRLLRRLCRNLMARYAYREAVQTKLTPGRKKSGGL